MANNFVSWGRAPVIPVSNFGEKARWEEKKKRRDIDIVKYCQYCFGFEMPSELWAKRISKLNEKIANCSNSFVARFSQV